MSDLTTHGVRESHRNCDPFDANVEEIQRVGYTVIDSGYSPKELQLIRIKIDAIYDVQVREIGGEDKLKAIKDLDLARGLIAYDHYFLNLAIHPGVMAITRKLLGEVFVLMSQNGIINRPVDQHYQVTWHRDLNYQHFVSSRPLAVSALFVIDDFSELTGGTYVLPASHKLEAFPSTEYALKHQKQVEASAGSILVFDAMLYHRAGDNRSPAVRRGVNHTYTLPLIKQQISFPRMLAGKFSEDSFLRLLLGYEHETDDGVQAWRERKLRSASALGASVRA